MPPENNCGHHFLYLYYCLICMCFLALLVPSTFSTVIRLLTVLLILYIAGDVVNTFTSSTALALWVFLLHSLLLTEFKLGYLQNSNCASVALIVSCSEASA